MAHLTYTFAELKGVAQHAAAKPSFDSGNTPAMVVNSALDYVARFHAWHWRIKHDISLDTLNAIATVDLPVDFGGLIQLWGRTSPYTTKRFRPVNQWEMPIIRQRATDVAANARMATTIFYTVTGKTQASVTALGKYQLEIHPVPTAVTDAFHLVYLRLPATMSGDTDVPDLPPDFQDVLYQAVRAFATMREMVKESDPDWVRLHEMLKAQVAFNGVIAGPDLAKLSHVVDDYYDVGKLQVTWS